MSRADSDQLKWRRMRFKNNKVWVALDDTGEPLIKNGKLLIKYQLDQPHEYWVHSRNVQPIDRSTDHAGPPPPKQRSRTATVPEMASVDCAESLCVFTDGACEGNPGPGSWAFVWVENDRVVEQNSGVVGSTTNNRMELLAVPFTPTHAEYIYLMGRNVLVDQMEFLRAHFPRSSPLLKRTG